MAEPPSNPGAPQHIPAHPEQPSGVTRVPGDTRDSGPFLAFRVLSYPTSADRAAKTNGRLRYVLTERETREVGARRSTRAVAAPLKVVEVALRAGHFRVWTAEGRCGITEARGIIGLDLAIRTGIAVVRPSP